MSYKVADELLYSVSRTTTDVDVVVRVSREESRTGLVSVLRKAGLQVDEERIDAAAIDLRYGYEV